MVLELNGVCKKIQKFIVLTINGKFENKLKKHQSRKSSGDVHLLSSHLKSDLAQGVLYFLFMYKIAKLLWRISLIELKNMFSYLPYVYSPMCVYNLAIWSLLCHKVFLTLKA